MDGRENSKVQPFREQEQYTSPYFSYPSFSLYPLFSTIEFNDLKNAKTKADSDNFNSFTPTEDSSGYSDVSKGHLCAKSDGNSSGEADEVSLDELLLDGKIKKKIELLAAMVGVDTTEPAIVLTEVVRALKVLKRINQY